MQSRAEFVTGFCPLKKGLGDTGRRDKTCFNK